MLEELYQIATDFKEGLVNLLPKMITSLIVLGIGYLIAHGVRFLLVKLLLSIGKMFGRQLNHIELKKPAEYVGTTFFWLVLAFTLLLITDILNLTIIRTGMEGIIRYTPNILAAILVLFAANILSKVVGEFMISVSSRLGFTYGNVLAKVARLLILLTAIIIVVDQIGIEVTFLINLINIVLATLLFSAALAFGLGARTSLSNILAAYYVRKLYKEGDQVQIDGVTGKIAKIDTTAVLIDTMDGRVVIPTKVFSESKSMLIKKNR